MKTKLLLLFSVIVLIGFIFLSLIQLSCAGGNHPTLIGPFPTNTCIGDFGETLKTNPPPVNNGSIVTLSTTNCQSWDFNLYISDTIETDPNGNTVNYKRLEVCTNRDINWGNCNMPVAGWATQDRFHGSTGTRDGQQTSIKLGTSGYGFCISQSSDCIISCYLRDQNGNLHLLNSFTCSYTR